MAEQEALVEVDEQSQEVVKPDPRDELVRVAILDQNNLLEGYAEVTRGEAEDGGLVIVHPQCDWKPDKSAKYDHNHKAFFPVGYGFERPERAPVETDLVVYKLALELRRNHGVAFDTDITAWMRWFEEQMLRRVQEATRRRTNVVRAR